MIELVGRDDSSWTNLTVGGWGNANPRAAENLSAVFACVDVIASALASLPPKVFRLTGTDRQEVNSPTLTRLLRKPNPWQSWPDFVQWFIAQGLLYGNAIAVMDRGRLLPIPWPQCSIQFRATGAMEYDYSFGQGSMNWNGRADQESVMHMRDRSDDGLIGRSRLARAGDVIATASELDMSVQALWHNGAFPSGAIKLPGKLTQDNRAKLRAELDQEFSGSSNRAKVLLLDSGMDWAGLSVDPDDAQTLQSREFQIAEIARLFEVPPPLIQDYSHNTFTNANTAGQWFSRFTLASWAGKFESAFQDLILDEDEYLELDMAAFQRADHGERWNAHAVALAHGVLTPDDVRRLEGL